MKKVIVLLSVLVFLTSCGIKIWDWEINIDGGEEWKIEIGHGMVNIEWKWGEKINIWGGKINITNNENTKSDKIIWVKEGDLELAKLIIEAKKEWVEWEKNEKEVINNKNDDSEFDLGNNSFTIKNINDEDIVYITENWVTIKNNENDVVYITNNSMTIKNINNDDSIYITDNSLTIKDSNNDDIVYITNNTYENEWEISKAINFKSWIKIWDWFKINDTLKIWDTFEFTDNSLKIGNYEIKEDWLYKNWKRIRSLSSLKNENFEITKDFIKYWDKMKISKDWIKFVDKEINKNIIKFSEKTYIKDWEIFFNWEEK